MKPVAWIAYDEFGDFMLEATPEGDYPWQPLYTTPRELSDEEILEIADNYWLEENYQIIEFVKSILKKANNG
jgi:hypothetical protein